MLILYNPLNSIINNPVSDRLDASLQTCEHFLKHFIEKIDDTRSSIQLPDNDQSVQSTCSPVFNQFEPVSLTTLVEIVEHLKPAAYNLKILFLLAFLNRLLVLLV